MQKATDAKKNTDRASAREQIQIEVLGSIGTDGTPMLDLLKTNLTNIGATVDGENFPLTVTLDGQTFTVDSNGNVEKAGPVIAVDESSVVITAEDGSSITKGEVPANTALKINFSASVDGGTVTISPALPHITTEAEMSAKKVVFTITGTVSGETVTPKTYTVDLKDVYESSEFSAEKIKENATTYYGAKVTGYTCEGTGVDTWRIFYSDSNNIYLIADDYIALNDAPTSANYSLFDNDSSGKHCKLSFNNVYRDYSGSEWILGTTTEAGVTRENSLAKNWLNKYFNYTVNGTTYPNRTSTNKNIRAVAYMLDTKIWSRFANSEYADYAIGGPTLEMFCTSYKESHTGSNISCDVTGRNGYNYSNASSLFSDCNGIYIKTSTEKAYAMWLASPAADDYNHLVYANFLGNLGHYSYNYNVAPGLRPLVCLQSKVQLTKVTNSEFRIYVENEND